MENIQKENQKNIESNTLVDSLTWLKNSIDDSTLGLIKNISFSPNDVLYSKKTLNQHIENKEYLSAVYEWLRIVSDVWLQRKSDFVKTWLGHYCHLDPQIQQLSIHDATSKKLRWLDFLLSHHIHTQPDIYKRLQLCYTLSQVKRSTVTKQYTWGLSQYSLLYKILKPGDILLLNTKMSSSSANSRLWAWLIYAYSPDTDHRTHSIMIGRKEGDTPYMIHATMKKIKDGLPWVEERNFCEYIESFESADILVLEPPLINKEKSIAYAYQKVEKWEMYDFWAAATQWSWHISESSLIQSLIPKDKKHMVTDHPDRVNCVELIAEWLGIERIKDIAFPEEFLDEEMLEPVYMTSLNNDN